MKEIVVAAFLFIISLSAFSISALAFKEKGFLFNNAYIYASKKERETMNKSPHYRQSAIVFLLLGIIFLLNSIATLFSIKWVIYPVIVIAIATIIYAIVSSVLISKKDHNA